jgi:hypothetical protein
MFTGLWRALEAAFEITALPLTNLEPSSFESVPEFCAMIATPWRAGIMDRVDAAISALGTCLLLAGAATLTLTYWL